MASPISGTETLTGTMTGKAVVRWLNSYGSAPPSFASLVFTGPVDTTLTGPLTVGSGNAASETHTFVTRAGNLTVRYTAKNSGGGQPTVTGRSGTTCYFRLDGGTGTYSVIGSEEVRGRDRPRHLRPHDPHRGGHAARQDLLRPAFRQPFRQGHIGHVQGIRPVTLKQ